MKIKDDPIIRRHHLAVGYGLNLKMVNVHMFIFFRHIYSGRLNGTAYTYMHTR